MLSLFSIAFNFGSPEHEESRNNHTKLKNHNLINIALKNWENRRIGRL